MGVDTTPAPAPRKPVIPKPRGPVVAPGAPRPWWAAPAVPQGNPGMPSGGTTTLPSAPVPQGNHWMPSGGTTTLDPFHPFAADEAAGLAMSQAEQLPPAATFTQRSSSPTGGGSSSGGGGGGGMSAADKQALMAAAMGVNTLFADWQQPQDTSLQDQLNAGDASQLALLLSQTAGAQGELANQTGQAQQAGATSLAQLQAALSAQQDPYTNKFNAPTVDPSAMQQYMNASGAGTGEVDSLQRMLQATANQSTQADQMMNDRQSQSWAAGQQSRQADATTSGTAFQQNLANTNAGMAAQLTNKQNTLAGQLTQASTARNAEIAAKQKEAKDAQKMAIINLAIQHGIDLSALGIDFTPIAGPAAPAPAASSAQSRAPTAQYPGGYLESEHP